MTRLLAKTGNCLPKLHEVSTKPFLNMGAFFCHHEIYLDMKHAGF